MGHESRRRAWTLAGVSLALFGVCAWRWWPHLVDDAFISFRYARHLATGVGLVFNPGERVEGYTNFLWVVLLALGVEAGVEPETSSRVAGLLAGVVMVVVVSHCAVRRCRTVAAWVGPLLLATHPALAVWATGGLETSLFACLVSVAACLLLDEIEGPGMRPRSAAVVGVAALTRPEGIAVAVWLLVLALAAQGPGKGVRGKWATWVGVVMLFWGPLMAWRWWYYGQLLPNTFYAKVGAEWAQVGRGFAYAHAFGLLSAYWLVPALVGLAFARPLRPILMLGGLVLGLFGYVVAVGGDGLPMYRFFVPILGPLMLLVSLGCEGWGSRIASSRVRGATVAAFGIVAAAMAGRAHFAGPDYAYVRQDIREVAAWRRIGLWFRDHAAPGASLAVLPAGAMPYYSGLPTVDMLGLTDATIAHTEVPMGKGQAGHEKYNLGYVLDRAPTYVVVGVYRLVVGQPRIVVEPSYPVEFALLGSEEFRRRYRPLVAETSDGSFTYFGRIE